jgi:putative membrane protein
MRLLKTILLILFVIAVVIFAVQNMAVVKLSFLNWHLQIPLAFASMAIYVLGAFSGGILFSMLRKLAAERDR